MINITLNEIRRLADDQTFRKGFKYYQQDSLFDLKSYGNVIKATVQGSEDYPVTIEFSNQTGLLIDYACHCHTYALYREPCHHIIAILLKILYSKEKLNSNFQASSNETLLNAFEKALSTNNSIEPSSKNVLQLEMIIEPKRNYKSSIGMRIGLNRLYVIQDIGSFLLSLDNKKPLSFNNSFTFDPQYHTFSAQDTLRLQLLSNYYYAYIYANPMLKDQNRTFASSLALPEHLFKQFLQSLGDTPFSIRHKGIISQSEYLHTDLRLPFTVKKTKNDIIISIESINDFYSLTKDKSFVFFNNHLYQLNEEEQHFMRTSNKYFNNNKSIQLNNSYKSRIASAILPAIKKIGVIRYDHSMDEQIVEEPLFTELFLDKGNAGLKGSLSFNYGNYKIGLYPPSKPDIPDNILLIRDVIKENKIINILDTYHCIMDEDKHFTVDGEENLYAFIYEAIPKLQMVTNVYYSNTFRNIHMSMDYGLSTGIKLNSNTNMLEFSFKINGISQEELSEILNTLRTKKKYYKLKNGSFIRLETPEMQSVSNLLDHLHLSSHDLKDNTIEIPKYRAIVIDTFFRQKTIAKFTRNRDFNRLVKDIRHSDKTSYKIPENLNTTLRDYQKLGYKWLRTLASYGFGGILADDMGLGKTLQAITLIKSYEGNLPSLVVAPTSLVYNWEDEIRKFAPDLKVCLTIGNKSKREALLQSLKEHRVIITSYGLLKRDIEHYMDQPFQYCFIDEAQHIKNPDSLNAKSVKLINASNRFALTGTPIENSLTELWSIFDFIMPGFLFPHTKFVSRFERPIIKDNDETSMHLLTQMIRPFILRRLKTDVLKELPPKIETKITTELLEPQKKLYLAYLSRIKKEFHQNMPKEKRTNNTMKILTALTRLRQICCHPSLFVEDYNGSSAKLELLEELVLDAIESQHRILIFSQFTSMLALIKEMLVNNGISTFYLDGQTPPTERRDMVHQFNNGLNDVFLISLKAGGTGLNLTGADMVIHYDPWWNPATENQATDRVYRIGQEKSVQVFKLITSGTIEEKIYLLQEAKKSLIESVIQPGETLINKLTEAELMKLLEI